MAKVALLCISLGALGSIANAIELQNICNANQDCTIAQSYDSIDSNQNQTFNTIQLGNTNQVNITTFTNNATISVTKITTNNSATSTNDIATFINNGIINKNGASSNILEGYISAIENYGTINGSIGILFPTNATNKISTITNSGIIYGISAESNGRVIIDNRNAIYLYSTNVNTGNKVAHLRGENGTQFRIRNYAIRINESQTTFNNFDGYIYTDSASLNQNSHLVITGNQVSLNNVAFDSNGKITIGFGEFFELGKAYSIAKIITDIDGNGLLPTSYFSRLISKDKDLYTITQSGDNFILNFAGDDAPSGGIIINTPITELYKSNIKTMNNFFL